MPADKIPLAHSLSTMASMIRQSSRDVAIHNWARKNAPHTRYLTPDTKAKALLDAIRARLRHDPGVVRETLMYPIDALRAATLDADDEAVLFGSLCETLGLETKLRLVDVGRQQWTVAVDVRSGGEWVAFTMGERP
jgi:hypothetical protein